jgi:cysteine synthase B
MSIVSLRHSPTTSTPAVVRAIGDTPLIRIRNLAADVSPLVSVFAKAEFVNPGGSVKDRPAWAMIRDGLESGRLNRDRTLLDATSGNTGIAYAMIGASVGFRVKLAIPANASPQRKRLLEAFGAELILTDPVEGTDGARTLVADLAKQAPGRYFYPDQYNNDANWIAHFETTGAEILDQTHRQVTHFVAALGTTGTFTGVSRRLKNEIANVQSIVVQPDTALHGIEGVKHIPSAIVPGIFDSSLQDDVVEVSTEEAIEMADRLAREEGLFVGPSSGANVTVALKLAQTLDRGTVVTVLCDSGERY